MPIFYSDCYYRFCIFQSNSFWLLFSANNKRWRYIIVWFKLSENLICSCSLELLIGVSGRLIIRVDEVLDICIYSTRDQMIPFFTYIG